MCTRKIMFRESATGQFMESRMWEGKTWLEGTHHAETLTERFERILLEAPWDKFSLNVI
jgi:hypothetical protein